MPQLTEGYQFPILQSETVNHGKVSLPGDIPGDRFSVVIAYRAHW